MHRVLLLFIAHAGWSRRSAAQPRPLAVLTPHQRRRPWLASPEPTCCLMYMFASPAGEAPPRPDHVPQAARHRHRPAVREVRRQVRGLRLICAAVHAGARVRRVQLRLLRRPLRHLRRHRHFRRLLLQGERLRGVPFASRCPAVIISNPLLCHLTRGRPLQLRVCALPPHVESPCKGAALPTCVVFCDAGVHDTGKRRESLSSLPSVCSLHLHENLVVKLPMSVHVRCTDLLCAPPLAF